MPRNLENEDGLIKTIRDCKNRKALEEKLQLNRFADSNKTIEFLNKCMYNPITNFSAGKNITLDEKLEMTKQMFLAGTWRLNEVYELIRKSKSEAVFTHA